MDRGCQEEEEGPAWQLTQQRRCLRPRSASRKSSPSCARQRGQGQLHTHDVDLDSSSSNSSESKYQYKHFRLKFANITTWGQKAWTYLSEQENETGPASRHKHSSSSNEQTHMMMFVEHHLKGKELNSTRTQLKKRGCQSLDCS